MEGLIYILNAEAEAKHAEREEKHRSDSMCQTLKMLGVHSQKQSLCVNLSPTDTPIALYWGTYRY